MSFLPIVERELRLAARRKSTYHFRFWTATIAAGAGLIALLLAGMGPSRGGQGGPPFTLLTSYTFGLCLLAGVLLTSDCLSQEKREGTLGLLFLTPLKGYDVVLGKFVARGLNAFYGLLALLPITALPVLAGGVTGAEFWRMALALANALFISLAAGLLVSALGRDPQGVLARTFGLLLFLAAGLPALAALRKLFRLSANWLYLALPSPSFPFLHARDSLYVGRPGLFWWALVVSQLLGWTFLGLASRLLPQLWQDRNPTNETPLSKWLKRNRCDAVQRTRARAHLLPINPVLWLASRDSAVRRLVWVVVAGWGVVALIGVVTSPADFWWAIFAGKGCAFLLKLLLAAQACRLFSQGRSDGSLEVLLCTPLPDAEILRGQWMALRRIFLGPVAVFLALTFMPFVFPFFYGVAKGSWAQMGLGVFDSAMGTAMVAWMAVSVVADMFAVCWYGLWLGLTSRRPSWAPALTVLFVLVLPGLVFCETFPPLSFCSLSVLSDLVFISFSTSRLGQNLRGVLARQSVNRSLRSRPGGQ